MKKQTKFLYDIYTISLIIVVVYNSGYLFMTTSKSIAIHLLVPTSVILIWFSLKKKIVKSFTLRNLAFFYFIFAIILTLIVNKEFMYYKLYIGYFLSITVAFFITQVIQFEKFVNYYIKTLKIITLISLVMYFLTNYLKYVFNFSIVQNVNDRFFYNAWLYFYPVYTNHYRNQGLFWEPGLYSSLLIIAIIFELRFKKNRISIINNIIFILGVISTNSTAGIMLLAPLLILYLDKNSKKKKYIKSIAINISLILFLLLGYINYNNIILKLVSWYPDIFSKLLGSAVTLTTRQDAPIVNLIIFSNNPIAGTGLSRSTTRFIELASNYRVDAQTSTSTYMMSALGVLGSLYTLFWLLGIFTMKNFTFLSKLSLAIIIITILNKEPHQGILVTWCIMFYFLKSYTIKKRRN